MRRKTRDDCGCSQTARHQNAARDTGGQAEPVASFPFTSQFTWPLLAGALAGEAMASMLTGLARSLVDQAEPTPEAEPGWETPHRLRLELQTMRLRDFSAADDDGTPTLICAPYALHRASVVDFAPGHSLVEALLASGIRKLAVTDWRSATPDMRFLPIDAYLADLGVAVDDLGTPVDLIGLCQGGWLALVYAARFPHKIRRLVLAGAPIDLAAARSTISTLAAQVPFETFADIVRLGDGRVLGDRALDLWGRAVGRQEAGRVLQFADDIEPARRRLLEQRFRCWHELTVDLPGVYYLQTVSHIFKQNRIATGRFMALGRTIDLAAMRAPLFLLGARDDEWVALPQLMAAASLVGTPPHAIKTAVAPCSHLGLFMGAETLQRVWPWIAAWLGRDLELARAS